MDKPFWTTIVKYMSALLVLDAALLSVVALLGLYIGSL